MCYVVVLLFFSQILKDLVFILFWNGDKYWNLLFLLPAPKILSHLSLFLTHLGWLLWKKWKEIMVLNTHILHIQLALDFALGVSYLSGMDQGTCVTTALTRLLLIQILRERKSAFHALAVRIPFCWGNSTGPSFSLRGLFLCHLSCLIPLNSTPYAEKQQAEETATKLLQGS